MISFLTTNTNSIYCSSFGSFIRIFFFFLFLSSRESFCHDLSFCFRPNYCNRSASSLSDSYNNDIVRDRRFLYSNQRNYIIKHSEKEMKTTQVEYRFFVRFQNVFFSTDEAIEEKSYRFFSYFFFHLLVMVCLLFLFFLWSDIVFFLFIMLLNWVLQHAHLISAFSVFYFLQAEWFQVVSAANQQKKKLLFRSPSHVEWVNIRNVKIEYFFFL